MRVYLSVANSTCHGSCRNRRKVSCIIILYMQRLGKEVRCRHEPPRGPSVEEAPRQGGHRNSSLSVYSTVASCSLLLIMFYLRAAKWSLDHLGNKDGRNAIKPNPSAPKPMNRTLTPTLRPDVRWSTQCTRDRMSHV